MNFSYPKKEKLKTKSIINQLFLEGKSVSIYPLRLVYYQHEDLYLPKIQMGVSVSKRHFKKAVDRNYYKRVLRETYRLNKQLLHNHLGKSYSIMFFYQTKERLSYQEINEITLALFNKFIAKET
jgi:ribonuclease P protein component